MVQVKQSEADWRETRDKWAHVWFEKLCRFHRRSIQPTWQFTAEDVVLFLRSHLKRNTPAWKRLKIVESLMCYRRYVQNLPCDDLKPIQSKLEEISLAERMNNIDGAGGEGILEEVGFIDPSEPDVIQNLRRMVRRRQDSLATERAYVSNVRAFMRERALTCQADFDAITSADVEAHLTDLAVDGNVSASTQSRAFYALLYLFQHVLKREMGEVEAIRAGKGKQIPTVLSVEEIDRIYSHLRGVHLLIARLLYGCGMRISEVLRLRMKDFDFDQRLIEVHNSKSDKSRFVPLPESLVGDIQRQMESRRVLHDHDLDQGHASVWLPKALEHKYPNAARELKWQFLFASHRLSRDPRTQALRRHHFHKGTFPARLRVALQKAGIERHVSSHTFRHSFATHLLRAGTDICTIQELLGHADIKTTRIYLHALNRDDVKVVSPLDRMTSKEPSPLPKTNVDANPAGTDNANERDNASRPTPRSPGKRIAWHRRQRVARFDRAPAAVIRGRVSTKVPLQPTDSMRTGGRWWKRAVELLCLFAVSGLVVWLSLESIVQEWLPGHTLEALSIDHAVVKLRAEVWDQRGVLRLGG